MLSIKNFSRAKPLGYEQLTGIAAATKLNVAKGARFAVIKCEAQNVRWRDDGVSPTAAIGMIMIPSDEILSYSGLLGQIEFIEAAVGGIVNISYYG